ncbi:MAG: hypothetical protein ABW321_21205, partial [Polyangiales bacterium]
ARQLEAIAVLETHRVWQVAATCRCTERRQLREASELRRHDELALPRRCAAFYVAGPDDDASAAVARLALERRLLGQEWSFGTDLAVAGTSRVDEALSQLLASVEARELQGRGLAGFLAQSDKRGPASVIVFGPPVPGEWLDAVTRVAGRRQLRVVIAVDGVAAAPTTPRWLGLFRREAPLAGAHGGALDEVLLALGRARVQVTLLDRPTGHAVGAIGQRALLRGAGARSGTVAVAHGSTA